MEVNNKFVIKTDNETWKAVVRKIQSMRVCYEIRIESRSGITLIVGRYSSGWFACLPDFGAGAGLSQSLSDVFYNTEVLERAIGNRIDAATVAQVLAELEKQKRII